MNSGTETAGVAGRNDDAAAQRRGVIAPACWNRARQTDAVREEIRLDGVLTLLAGTCQDAHHTGWDQDPQERAVSIVPTGLRPAR